MSEDVGCVAARGGTGRKFPHSTTTSNALSMTLAHPPLQTLIVLIIVVQETRMQMIVNDKFKVAYTISQYYLFTTCNQCISNLWVEICYFFKLNINTYTSKLMQFGLSGLFPFVS